MHLIDAMQLHGLVVRDTAMPDEQIHRCGTIKKPNGKNGWVIVYDGGKAAIFGNWEIGDGYEYWSDGTLSETDRRRIRVKIDDVGKQREKDHEAKAQEAIDYFESCAKTGFSDYLKNKKIYPHGARFDGNAIVIPLQDAEGKVWSYQRIYGDGSKYFMPGGKVKGCYFLIASRNISKDERVVVCEGFATGAAINQATELPVIVAFNAGNIKAVCDSIPFRNIVIAADNDQSGVGEKAAKETGYKYVMPKVTGWDFSDVFLGEKDVASYFIEPKISKDGEIIAHGLVAQIADWITQSAVRPQPMLSLAAALSFVAMLKGHRVCGFTDLRTNLLVMSLAPTAAGKEHPQNCIKKLMAACGMDKHLMGEPVSGGGFLTGLNNGDRVSLLVMDEIGRYLENLSGRNAGTHQREIIDYIIKTFSCANSVLKGRQYVDEKKNPMIDISQPHFCCLGSTVSEKLQSACGSSYIIDGFLNRWVVFNVKHRSDRNDGPKIRAVPQSLLDAISSYRSKPIKYNAYGAPEPQEVKFTPEAWEYYLKYRKSIDAVIARGSYPMDRLYSRACEHIEKIALILCDDEDILVSDIKLAIEIVNKSNSSIMEFAGLISDNVHEQDFIRVREIIKEAKDIRRYDLTKRTQFIQGGDRRRSEIISVLLDSNIIAARKSGYNNKQLNYKWIG